MKENANKFFAEKLLQWHSEEGPNHPWKNTNNPYFIWLSEIILQQTRVTTGTEYYLRFIDKFPTVEILAEASEDEVMLMWQGLGYYNRARNLHKTAKIISSPEYNGQFPSSSSELSTLPGIGPYTSAALASFAFEEKVPVVDGNVYRVLARFFGQTKPIDEGKSSYLHYALIGEKNLNFVNSSAEYNQAIMDFGATVCTPTSPCCDFCPLSSLCQSFQENLIDLLPVKTKKTKITTDYLDYLVLSDKEGNIVLKKRKNSSYWPSLYEPILLGSEKRKSRNTINQLAAEITNSKTKPKLVFSTKHILSHKLLKISLYSLVLDVMDSENLRLLTKKENILTRAMPQPLYLYFRNNYLT